MNNVQIQRVFTIDKNQMNKVKNFLQNHKLELELPVDALYIARDGEQIIGTGGIKGKIIKMFQLILI